MSGQEHDLRQQDALREIERLHRQGDALGGAFAQRAGAADAADPIERWGRRIGRALSLLALLLLGVYLLHAYVR